MSRVKAALALAARGHQVPDHVGDAGVLFRREADVIVGGEGLCDVLAKESSDGAAVDSADQLADEMTEGEGRIAVLRPGRPPRLGLGERGADGVPVVEALLRQRLPDRREARFVTEEPTDRDLGLPGLGELGPVARDGGIEIEATLLDEAVGADRRQALGRRVGVDEGVALPFAGAGGVGEAAPEIDDELALERERDRRADLLLRFEALREDVADGLEAGIAVAVDGDHRCGSPSFGVPGGRSLSRGRMAWRRGPRPGCRAGPSGGARRAAPAAAVSDFHP
jgi:hypothetical protein